MVNHRRRERVHKVLVRYLFLERLLCFKEWLRLWLNQYLSRWTWYYLNLRWIIMLALLFFNVIFWFKVWLFTISLANLENFFIKWYSLTQLLSTLEILLVHRCEGYTIRYYNLWKRYIVVVILYLHNLYVIDSRLLLLLLLNNRRDKVDEVLGCSLGTSLGLKSCLLLIFIIRKSFLHCILRWLRILFLIIIK